MKLTMLIMTVFLLQVSALTKAQITLKEDATTLQKVLKSISKQSGYDFVYSNTAFKNLKLVTVRLSNVSIEDALKACFENQPLVYEIYDKTVMVKRKEVKSAIDRVKDFLAAIDVRGRVVDEKGQPLLGASVKVKNVDQATVTDASGAFYLQNVPDDAVLVISYIGYNTKEVKANSNLDRIKMELSFSELDQVQIIAYGTTTKRFNTGNVSSVKAKDIENQPVTSPLMALQGRVAGLEIIPNNGTPGGAPTVRIRGLNTLRNTPGSINNEGNFPLYIIDGIPVNPAPIQSRSGNLISGGYDPLSTINPANIASIEVLKDADGTAIYGSRGANGVILITTKQGIISGNTNLDLSIYKGVGEVSKKLDLLNTQQYLAMRKEAYANDGVTIQPFNFDVGFWDPNRYTDWQEELLGGTANITDMQGNITGGNATTSYRMGGGYHQEGLIFPGDFGYQRATGSLSLNHTSPNQKFKSTISLNYGSEKHKLFNGNLEGYALTLAPNAPSLYNEQGELNWEPYTNGRVTWINPLASSKKPHHSANRNLIANGSLEYEIISGLKLRTNLGYTDMNGDETIQNTYSSMNPDNRYSATNPFGLKAYATFGNNHRQSILVEPQLSFEKKSGEHSFNILAGATYQKNTDESQQVEGTGYSTDALLNSITGAGTTRSLLDEYAQYKYNALFGRIGYNYKNKYLLNLTGRRDGSSRFGPGKQFGNFGAIGAAWIFSEEALIKNNLPFLSFGKIRTSFGTTGSDQIGDYKYYSLYRINSFNYQNETSLSPDALFNPDYFWEKTRKVEAAIELGLFQNRISIEASWYRHRSSNQLVNTPLPATTGFDGVSANWGATVENTGWEMVLRADLIRSEKLQWTASANLSIPHNKLVSFPNIEQTAYKDLYQVGESISVQKLYTYKGVNAQTGLYDFADINNDGVIDPKDMQFMNPRDRAYYGGINNTLRYKAVELSFLLQFASQKAARYIGSGMPGTAFNQSTQVLDRWQQSGDISTIQKFSQQGFGPAVANYNYFLTSDQNTVDASFMRLKTFTLAVNFPQKMIDKINLKDAKLFVQGQNLLTFTGYKNLDPETGNSLPPLRMITIGTQLKF